MLRGFFGNLFLPLLFECYAEIILITNSEVPYNFPRFIFELMFYTRSIKEGKERNVRSTFLGTLLAELCSQSQH